MRASRFLEAKHDRAQVGLAQPLRGEPLEHAAFIGPLAKLVERPAFAGDDDDQSRAARLRMAKEAAQRLMRLGLGQPMQIERRVDRGASARKFTLEPPFDRRERRRGGLRRSGGRRLGGGWRRGGGPGGPDGIRRRRAVSRRAAARQSARPRSRARSPRRSGASNAAGAAAYPSRLVPSRQKHDELGRMANGAGARARRVAAAEEEVGARRSHNRRAGVLGDHEPAERPGRLVHPRQSASIQNGRP